jgi:arylsulfatase A-like enzyme
VSEKCLDFIESGLDGRPLFLYLSFIKPHAGHNVPKGYEKLYDLKQVEYAEQPPWREDHSPHARGVNRRKMYEEYWSKASEQEWKLMTMRYWANCTWIDDMFGRVLEALKRKGVLKNSLIVYVSDHGEMLGERYYRFNKYNLYESSVRVPIILSGSAIPEELRGSTVHRPVELVDIYPTLLSVAEVPSLAVLPGLDLLDRQTRSGSFSALHERPQEAAFMWRTRHHKLILRMKRKADASKYTASDIIGGEFYDLQADGKEWNNLYDQHEAQPNVRKRMTKDLLKHLGGLAPLPPITGGS